MVLGAGAAAGCAWSDGALDNTETRSVSERRTRMA